jgi:hypothetical protein|tara:strand:+ start:443 stop:1297 length:855 start_codon:yes stop_codon:yes gene_type:complete
MKILIQNYSSHYTTEPFYLTECLRRAGIDSHLWADANVPAFDMFDTIAPDVFLGHFAYLTEDIVKYLSQNKNIKPVINITGTNQQQLKGVTDTFMSMGLENVLLFTNNFVDSHGDSVHRILPAFDVFIQRGQAEFDIPLAVITNNKEDSVDKFLEDKEVYHLVSYGANQEWSDFTTDIRNFWAVSSCYDDVTVIDDGMISTSQFFFQATMMCKNLNIISQTEEQREAFQEILSILFSSEQTSEDVGAVVRKQILKNHTCFNRASQLASILGLEEESKKLLEMVE